MNDRIVAFMHYHPVRTQRGLEILSGLVPWAVIAFIIVGSFFFPETVAYFVIGFNVYALYRSFQLAINATSGYLNIRATRKINWQEKLASDLSTSGRYKDIWHLVVIPNYKEPVEILERTLESLASQNYDHKKMYVALGMEKREGESAEVRAKKLQKKFKNTFGRLLVTYHPLVINETAGKHSNNTFATKAAKKLMVEEEKIPIEKILITTCDADSVFPQDYFSLLTYKFLTSEKPYNRFYQAPLLMYNNINRLPFLARIPNIIGGIYFLSTLRKASGRFMNYSSYSTSLALLDKVGYWDVDVIPEDWHINLKSYFALKGDVAITPMFLPIFLDAAESTTTWKTFVSNYEQIKRWAWGIVDVPYVVKKFFEHPEISFWDKMMKLSLTLEWHFMWSSSWFLITLGALIPTVINPTFARTSLGFNLSRLSSSILTLGLVGVLAITIIDILLDPHKSHKVLSLLHPFTYLQWIFLPVVGLVFGSLPGLESQTRLMLGKYLEYRLTEKVHK